MIQIGVIPARQYHRPFENRDIDLLSGLQIQNSYEVDKTNCSCVHFRIGIRTGTNDVAAFGSKPESGSEPVHGPGESDNCLQQS